VGTSAAGVVAGFVLFFAAIVAVAIVKCKVTGGQTCIWS